MGHHAGDQDLCKVFKSLKIISKLKFFGTKYTIIN